MHDRVSLLAGRLLTFKLSDLKREDGQGVTESARQRAKNEFGMQEVAAEYYNFQTINDFTPIIVKFKQLAPDIDYGIALMPVSKKGDPSVTWAGGWSFVIPQGAKHPEEAFKFMQYIAGEPGQKKYTKDTAHLPTLLSLQKEDDLYEERHRFFAQQLLPTAKNRPPLPVGALYWNELTTAWQKAYLNQDQPKAALQTAHDRVQSQLQQYCPIKITT